MIKVCPHNGGVMCDEVGRGCKGCGFHPIELQRRASDIEQNGLLKNAAGNEYLSLRRIPRREVG